MSYILDALRKAEQQRRLLRVPTLEDVYAPGPKPRPRVGPWVVALAILVNAAVLAGILHLAAIGRGRAPSPVAYSPAAPPAPAGDSPGRAREPAPSLAAAVPAPAASTPTVRAAAPTAPVHPAPGRPALEPPGPASPGPPIARTRPEPAPLPAAGPARPPTMSGAVAPAAASPAAPSGTESDNEDEAPAPAPAGPRVAGAPPARDSAVVRGPVEGLTLDVLVYSETAAQRLVFINSKRYVEGDRVEGKFVVEAITVEGAVLRYEGQRLLLRPKSNPYVR
ncbi:MAG TPA: general secretion pathway protein GspB [Methylomirabilota bacterium]|jgi:general secretion pathway protein B|nr:general secretion pathway protein GspB [Methylomirabilota bacterium]